MTTPVLDSFDLPLAQSIEGTETEALEQHGVPGLEGDFLQDLGRRAARIRLSGVASGAQAADALKTLREKHRAAAPISFVADIATATRVNKVLIEQLEVREFAGRPERFAYSLDLLEFVPAPTPEIEIPPPPPPPVVKTTSALQVTVIVDDDPSFDFSNTAVTVAGPLTAQLTDRNANVWTRDPIPPGAYTASATAVAANGEPMSGSAGVRVDPGQRARVEIHLHPGPAIAHAFIVHYWFDKALIEPCLRRVMRDVAAYAKAHPDEKMLIVGHTDLTGSDEYNQALSERRARGVFAYLTAGRAHDDAVDEWDRLRAQGQATTRLEDNWKVREYQHLLSGLGYYGGHIDEAHGPLTDAAVRNFQSDHGLGVDGIVGNETWRSLIDAYLGGDALAIPESQFLPNCPGEIVKWLGSGEKDPVRNTEDAFRPNRRTEIVFVKASALPGKVAPPVTFDLPAPGGSVNTSWCAGQKGDPVVILSRTTAKPGTFLIEPAEPGPVVVQGTMTFEDGSPAGGVQYVLTAPDGEYLDGERPSGVNRGRPVPGTTKADGTFAYPDKPKNKGVFILSISGPFTVRLKDAAPNSGTTPIVCARLDGSRNLDVVLAAADGVDPRLKLKVTLFDRLFRPLATSPVAITFPDTTTADATTDEHGRFSTVMPEAFKTVNLRYAGSPDPDDVVQRDYFIDPGDIATDEGVTRRLHNLGFEPATGLPGAVAQFQGVQGFNPTGEIDDDTRARLGRLYEGDAPLFPEFDDTPVIVVQDPLSTDP